MNWNTLLADAAAPVTGQAGQAGQAQQPPGWFTFVPMILLAVVFYVVLVRPQQKRAKQQALLISNLKSGDKVATVGGIIGTVVTVKDNTISLRSADAKMEITKSSVTEILESSTPTEAKQS